MRKSTSTKKAILRPPIVTILGHVDHGKTTLLDTIRKTKIVEKEYGGITQHIGAYQVEISKFNKTEGQTSSHKITFIDTPGHEAFAKMRDRGVKVADIAILVVAGNDGVQPQTIESIEHIKNSHIPSIIAINKIDIPNINIEKIKKQLVKAGMSLEEYGGDAPVVLISAKTGQGLDKLLDTILLVAELFQDKEVDNNIFQGLIIESSLSKTKGPIATIIIRSGGIKIGDNLISVDQSFRVRSLIDFQGNHLYSATAGDPVEILGWQVPPIVGSQVFNKNQSSLTKLPEQHISKLKGVHDLVIAPPLAIEEEKIKLIIKSDTSGSLEAILAGLIKNSVDIIFCGAGNITESDILLAKTAKALVIGFNIKPNSDIIKLANSEKVLVKTFNLIYELFSELSDVIEAIKKGDLVTILGEAKILALFNYNQDIVAGIKVVSGRIARGDQVKIMRKDIELGRAKIKSLRHDKTDISKIEQGKEAGLILSQKVDFLTGDSIISIG